MEARSGQPGPTADGVLDELRLTRSRALAIADAESHYGELVGRAAAYSLVLAATTTGVTAGQIVGAAAAAATQFALLNPPGSGKNLVLLRFGMGIISGTPAAGPLFHGYLPSVSSISAPSPGGAIRSNLLGQAAASVAVPWALAAGSALTGGQAPVTHSVADFATTATAQASPGELKAVENLDGALVVPPGAGWLPLWGAAGTSLLNGYSITWEEIPV